METDSIDVDGYTPSPVSSDNYEPSFEPDNSSDNDESSESFTSDETKEEREISEEEREISEEEREIREEEREIREEEREIREEKAEKKVQIFISFRQINGFNYDGSTITFNFYGLTSQDLAVPYYLTY